MTHNEIVSEIMARARNRGMLSHYCPDSRSCMGDPGFPDLVVTGLYGTVFFEVKSGYQERRPSQTVWAYTLLAGNEQTFLIHESDLHGGILDSILDQIQHG